MFSRSRAVFAVVFSLVVLSPLAIDIFLPALPEMTRFFSANTTAMQLTISLFMVCMGFGQLVAGPLSDRYGRRASTLAGLALYIAGSLLAMASTTLTMLYLARALQGLGSASCAVTAFAWVRDRFNAHDSGKWISYMGGMIGTIPTLAPLLGGILTVQFGWQANFAFMAALGVVLLLLAVALMEPDRPVKISGSARSGADSLFINVREIISHRQFITFSLTGMLTMGGILAYATNAPFVAMSMAGLDAFGFAMAFGALGMLQLVASIMAPRLVNVIGRRRTVVSGIVMALAGALALLPVTEEYPMMFFAASSVAVIGFNLIFGTAAGLSLEHFHHCSGLAAAIDGCMRIAGGGLVVMLIKLAGLSIFSTAAFSYSLLVLPLLLILFWEGRPDSAPADQVA